MDNEIDIVLAIYRGLISNITNKGIPVDMRPQSLIGTVQDDPFDCWIGERIKAVLPPCFELFHSGQLTTPDIVVRDRAAGTIIGLEIKKLIQRGRKGFARTYHGL